MTPTCRFKDLCIDVVDPQLAAPFWAAVLDLSLSFQDDGSAVLTGAVDEQTVWINPVPEPRTTKNRMHLDVNTEAIADLVARGARVLDGDSFTWTVLADPEGAEFCGFVRDPVELTRHLRLYEVSVDARDPVSIATWWGEQWGATVAHDEPRGFSGVGPGGGLPWSVIFAAVPEPKTVKNRLHWDVWGSTPDLISAGATLLRPRDPDINWDVLADPEGNEFCVFTPLAT